MHAFVRCGENDVAEEKETQKVVTALTYGCEVLISHVPGKNPTGCKRVVTSRLAGTAVL